jgi:oligosaccharide translocation protein RFT1
MVSISLCVTTAHLAGGAALLELLAEPFYILATINMRFQLRAVMDSVPLALKSVATLALLAGWAGPGAAALPPAIVFSLAQLAFAAVTLIGYISAVGVPLLSGPRTAGASKPAATEAASASAADAAQQSTISDGGVHRLGFWLTPWRRPAEREALNSTAMFWVQAVRCSKRL